MEANQLRNLIREEIKNQLLELKYKIVIRKGKRFKKPICPPNAKVVGKKCVPIKGSEKAKRKRSAKKGSIKRKGKMARILKKRAKSMKRRQSQGLDK